LGFLFYRFNESLLIKKAYRNGRLSLLK